MSPYILGEAADQIDEEDPPIYDLYATVNHFGTNHLGHYLAIVRPPGDCEDGKLSSCGWSVFLKLNQYQLSILNYCVTQSHINNYYQHLFTNICLAARCVVVPLFLRLLDVL